METQYPKGVFLKDIESLYKFSENDLHILILNEKIIKIKSINNKIDIYLLNVPNNADDHLKKIWYSL